jgi:butyrate kinase
VASTQQKQLDRLVFGSGGVSSYLGTKDWIEVERRIDSGDEKAAAVCEAMVYQIAKEAGAMAAVLRGKVDAVFSLAEWRTPKESCRD